MNGLPKVELHLHLEGAAPPAFIAGLAKEKHLDIAGVFDERGNYRYKDFWDFLKVYEAATSALLGKLGSSRNSCATGENSTSLGADLPLYDCPSVCLMNAATFSLNFARPASPAHDSL